MAFKDLPGGLGMIYVPEKKPCPTKFPCPTCFSCQWCSNERCLICRHLACAKKPAAACGKQPQPAGATTLLLSCPCRDNSKH